jgi:hypothetical protein
MMGLTEQEKNHLTIATEAYEEEIAKIKRLQKKADDAYTSVLQPLVKEHGDNLDDMIHLGLTVSEDYPNKQKIYHTILLLKRNNT